MKRLLSLHRLAGCLAAWPLWAAAQPIVAPAPSALAGLAMAAAAVPAAVPAALPAASAPQAAADASPLASPPPPPPPAFQGLPWGAEEAQIGARFGARLQPTACDAAQRAAAERRGEACDSPAIARYEVAGVPFVLTLHLDAAERRLQRVTLSHVAEHGRSDEPRWTEHHRVMRRLLSQRYGGPEFTDLQTEGGLSTAQARWRTGPALIELQSTFQARSGNTPAREHILITYQSPLHGEAAKL